MRILVVGSGGREHALVWKLSKSPAVSDLFAAPGNGGTSAIAQNVPIAVTDIPALVSFARQEEIDLTVVGPEAPLVAGLVDRFAAAGLMAFGPSASAARLEGSKAFAKQFMVEEGIPTALGAVFRDHDAALAYLIQQKAPVVVKASGLAAGKGVFVCETLEEGRAALHLIMQERIFGAAGDEVLIESCLVGEEVSLLAFSDGETVTSMVSARDYKRAGDGDVGPNTGGMGCYAPSPHLDASQVDEIERRVLQPAVDGMRRRGTPDVGVLYAGLMLTSDGPRVLEFNCRFGDPETQVLLPLLKTDLVDIVSACMEGRLSDLNIVWQDRHAVSVVLASGGYPRSYAVGKEILGISDAAALDETVVFQAGTRVERGHLATAGGRVLAVTAVGDTLEEARDRAYRGVQHIRFDGLQYRRDIGELEATTLGDSVASERAARAIKSAYAAAGVDIEAGNQAVDMMREAVAATYTDAVLAGIGPFGGLFSARSAYGCADDPVLVASTDGVGTKTMIAAAMGKYDTIGHDIVNHCLNDTLVQGARPLFFLDYVATGAVDPEQIAAIVTGCAEACGKIGCALIGGETAEMPGVYRPGTFDLVGTMVSWVERNGIVDGHAVEVGDVCIGIPSSGLHTNGYSLARRVFSGVSWSTVYPELGEPLGDVLLTPHRAYLREVEALWEAGVCPKAMAHITGGGFPDNLPRVLPSGVGVALDRSTWDTPPVFRLIQRMGQVSLDEMYRVYNMGIGLVIIVAAEDAQSALDVLAGDGRQVGVTFAHEGGPRVRW